MDYSQYIKDIISRNGLVSSGRLLRNTSLSLVIEGAVLVVVIKTLEYFPALDFKYKLTDQLFEYPPFVSIVEGLIDTSASDFLNGVKPNMIGDIRLSVIY